MAMPYMNGVQYNKPIQPISSSESRRRTKCKTERTVEDAGTSEKSVPSVLQLMDSSIRQTHSSDDDDNFVAPPPRRLELSAREKSPVVKGPSAVHHSQEEPQSHGTQRDDADNKVLKVELDKIKSQMSSLNEGKNNKMDDIVQMQACIKSDLMDIRTNMQFLSESMSAMVSSAMDEIIRRSGNRTSERGVGQTEVGDQEHHPAFGSDKAQEVENVVSNVDRKGNGKMDPSDDLPFFLEPPSFDFGIEYIPPNVLHSKKIQKRVDSIISDVVTATKTDGNEGSSTSEPTSELPVKWILRPVRDYKDNVDEVEKSAFMSWFQRAYKPKNKKKFSEEDDSIKPTFLIGSFPIGHSLPFGGSPWADIDYVFMPIISTNKAHWTLSLLEFRSHTLMVFNSTGKSYRDWEVMEGIEPYIKVLSALINALGISKKDPDYQEPEVKELNVIIDDTLPQQTNGFDASKFRMDIDTLLYKHRQIYTMTVNLPTTIMRKLLIVE
ncbi:sentrin-specific protease 1-like [Olea europaea subsp. europaea]|uniref:Sentrin-specific protease 1-like n=1 Tax=Olea europaea subsp. europaea TaxID=158383 RepID=A0A8S0PBI5_OLEEU|nr:sentrin-specific protease 1-like [Olea europaea subsp. europaea]